MIQAFSTKAATILICRERTVTGTEQSTTSGHNAPKCIGSEF